MDRRDIEEIVELTVSQTVPAAVSKTLESYGVDVRNPLETQRDMLFLRSFRTFVGSSATKVVSWILLIVLGAATAWAVSSGKLPFGG